MIPQVGFYLMAILPALTATAQSMMTALFFVAFSEIFGNFVVPKIRGEAMRLHPAYLLGTTLLLGFAFGIVGVLIAAAVAGTIKVYVEEFYLARRSGTDQVRDRVADLLGPRTEAERG